MYGEATLVFDIGAGLVVYHKFLVADITANYTLLGMDFLAKNRICTDLQTEHLEEAGHS